MRYFNSTMDTDNDSNKYQLTGDDVFLDKW